ncbi:MAG: patatin-like phospholipase family protein [Cellvibrionaceae bacterium]|nr:patatin-like phospholipase family protein [Cellvibrionaceae bacterium]
MKKKYTALVLQGGGALGAYEYGVIKALYEQKNFSPDIITGVSIGAFSAAVLTGAKDDPIAALGHLWELFTAHNMPLLPQPLQLLLSLPYNAGMYSPNPYAYMAPALVTHFCDTKALYHSLSEVIDLHTLNAKTSPHMVISATNIESGELESFDNRKDIIDYKHIVASGSLPPSFPMTEINNNHYWDGGLFSNTPLKSAFKCLEKLGDKNCEREIILIELFPNRGKKPNNMPDVIDRMLEIIFSNKIHFDTDQYGRTSDYIDMIEAMDKELPATSGIRKLPAFKKLMSYRRIHKFSVIRNTSPESLLGGADFTEKTIDQRIQQGYADGKAYVKAASA